MHIKLRDSYPAYYDGSIRLMRRMFSPLCGLNPAIEGARRHWMGPRFISVGAELTGVHLLNQRPQANSYHIGWAGIFQQEVLWRTLGESIERYAQAIGEVSYRQRIVMASYNELLERGEPVLPSAKLRFFSADQYGQSDFPFQPFSPDRVIGWVKMPSLLATTAMWVPAQLVLVGYGVKLEEGEPWLLSAVTTGSAAHTDRLRALCTALLELIELDAAMGHWFSPAVASEIVFDRRTRAIERLVEKHCHRQSPRPHFYWLPNADLPGMTVACLFRQKPGILPAVSLGLGCSLTLGEAMYKALLEAMSTARFGIIASLEDRLLDRKPIDEEIDPHAISDLDHNVVFYSSWDHCAPFESKFPRADHTLLASDLPADTPLDLVEQTRYLVESFQRTGKDLLALDLSTVDIKALGFTALRAWSPDLLSLSLPSYPPKDHPRFQAYGGCCNEAPHPYP